VNFFYDDIVYVHFKFKI